MNSKWKKYTPDGVQDQLFESCFIKRNMEAKLREFLREYEYNELETPMLEFYDTYTSENGMVNQETMYKMIDQQGRLLVLRPDMTVPVARVVATKIDSNLFPVKCFYIGDCFRFNESGGGRQRQFTQAGIEIIGKQGAEADAEVIIMAIKSLLCLGVNEFRIDLGQVEFFKGLMEEANIDGKEMEEVRLLIDSKDFIGLERLLDKNEMRTDIKKLVLNLTGHFGTTIVLDEFIKMDLNDRCKKSLDNLKEICDIIKNQGYEKYVSVDLGMVKSLDYYSGLIFKGFTHGVGFPVLGGGRYDNLVSEFGVDAPATGFSLGINMLMNALDSQKRLLEIR